MGKFVRADSIVKGDIFLQFNGEEEIVKTIEYYNDTTSINVYDISVSGNHNYFANELLVHNKCGKYKGSDEDAENAIDADRQAWEAAQSAMALEDEKVKMAIDRATSDKKYLEKQNLLENKQANVNMAQQVKQANAVYAQTNFASSGAPIQANDTMRDANQLGYEARQLSSEDARQNLIDSVRDTAMGVASNKASLYANYVGNMASSYSNVPEAPETYGTDWDFGQTYGGGSTGSDFSSSSGSSTFSFGAGSCLVGDTKILTPNNDIYIKDLKLGEGVKTYNTATKTIEENEITDIMKHSVNEFLIINNKLKVTGNHLIYISKD